MTRVVLLLLILAGGCGDTGSKASTPDTTTFSREDAPPVSFRVPVGWVEKITTSKMRLTEYLIPGDEALLVVVYFFGEGGGGGRDANLDRWKGQLEGATSKTESFPAGKGVEVTLLVASGTYVAETMPGSGIRTNKPDQRLLAAFIDCPGGPLFAKVVGDRAMVDAAEADFRSWLTSFVPGR